jgi:outer membrane lipoprotein carrier protein
MASMNIQNPHVAHFAGVRGALVMLCALGLALPALAQAAGSARAQLDAFASGLQSVSAHFSQISVDANGNAGRGASGTLQLAAPRLFRWQVDKPYHQLIVADGKRVWVYDPDLQQVTVRAQNSAEAHSPLNVLTDLKLLDRQFKVNEEGTYDGEAWLKLRPNNDHAEFKYAELGFADNQLQTMVFEDLLGDRTTIRFSDWRRNVKLPADTFRFTPPPGADVIGDVPTAEAYPLKN